MMRGHFLVLALVTVLSACGTWRGLEPSSASQGTQVLTTQARQDLVLQAVAMLDRNYTYGGKKLHTGFDCSGFVSFVYKESAGLRVNGSASDIARQTRAIEASQAEPGDLVFFNTLGSSFSHVGIYIGNGKFIHKMMKKFIFGARGGIYIIDLQKTVQHAR